MTAKFRNQAMLFDVTIFELFNTGIDFKRIFCLTVMKKNGHIFHLNTGSRISLCNRAHYLRYVECPHQGQCIAVSDF